jgi:hypothetical protein
MAKVKLFAAVTFLVLTVALASSFAGATVDPQLFIGQAGCLAPAGGDPNIIGNTDSFCVGVVGQNFTTQDPLLIIVGVYNGDGVPSISFADCTIQSACPAATTGTYGLGSATGTMIAGQDAYTQLGLVEPGAGQASESFTNWSAADVTAGFAAPSSFTLYAFALPGNLSSGTPFSIDESGAASGSFVIGFDCKNGTGGSSGCTHPGDVFATPFTNAGLITSTPEHKVPEPGGLALLGSGLVLIGGLLRRKFGLNR